MRLRIRERTEFDEFPARDPGIAFEGWRAYEKTRDYLNLDRRWHFRFDPDWLEAPTVTVARVLVNAADGQADVRAPDRSRRR